MGDNSQTVGQLHQTSSVYELQWVRKPTGTWLILPVLGLSWIILSQLVLYPGAWSERGPTEKVPRLAGNSDRRGPGVPGIPG